MPSPPFQSDISTSIYTEHLALWCSKLEGKLYFSKFPLLQIRMGHKRYYSGRFAEHKESSSHFWTHKLCFLSTVSLCWCKAAVRPATILYSLDPISAPLTSVLGCVFSSMTKGPNFSTIFMPSRLEATRMDIVLVQPCELQSMPVDHHVLAGIHLPFLAAWLWALRQRIKWKDNSPT